MSEQGLAVAERPGRTEKMLLSVSSDDPPSKRKDTCLEKAKELLSTRLRPGAKAALFSHPCPDPDAIGSLMGLSWLLQKAYGAEVYCFYDGYVGHPQNQRIFNLLEPELLPLSQYTSEDYVLKAVVDTIPAHAATPGQIDFDLVIDHHKEVPNGGFKGLFLNLRTGSACAAVWELIKQHGLCFEEDNERDSRVATAMLAGIITDTEFQTSDDTTDYEHGAYRDLFEFRNSAALKQIIRYKHPKEWVQARAAVALKAQDNIKDGVLIHGVGFISGNNRDMIANVADEMLSWEGVETSIAFAVIDGDRVEGSVRSSNAAIHVPQLCKEFAAPLGSGGGKLGKGAYSYSLGSVACDPDMDESTKNKMWDFINDREIKRLHRIIR